VQVNSLRRVRDKLYKYEIRATEPQSDFMRFKRCPSHSDIRFNIIFGRIDCQAFQTVKLSFMISSISTLNKYENMIIVLPTKVKANWTRGHIFFSA